ncbi:Gfo/Idh/MocA family protein [Novipirellula artificiosorum]|uniref:Inositol 2-dehydrogenase/D-chiro-inositol 3-dehydrogenase n=1 Tax=Novipirellula artificiosorum TaxID=2528016 RepID=A0A5C6E383_9BACT|nr:Gfo/Idh/MocA family oxidoreductase [Novipirellula artificiosorum]TWU42091.1 Inositol 2-dehydrogenase/D-chiro-inositol 3-dehydrogenase [Novipirellula artificiosorum]
MNAQRPPAKSTTDEIPRPGCSRRSAIKAGSTLAIATTFAAAATTRVHASEDGTIQLALIGCGGRGSGAVVDALSVAGVGPVKLVAMADLFAAKMTLAEKTLKRQCGTQIDVPPERQFAGFDAYKQAIDCLKPGDVALLTGYAYCRAAHMEYAVSKGVHVFMEKSFAPDPAGCQRMLRIGEQASNKNVKIATGLMCRHSVNRQALIQKIRDGELGDLMLINASRMGGVGKLYPRPSSQSEVEYQIRNRYYFQWASAGLLSEFMIHQIDECCWLKDQWPVAARGVGGVSPYNDEFGQCFDSYCVEYRFADGATALVTARFIGGCEDDFATYVHGTKKAGQFSGNIHRATTRTYQDHRIGDDCIAWEAPEEPRSPYVAEWDALLTAIRHDQPHNETQRSIYANLATIMGRAAIHCGRTITWDEVLHSNFRFAEDVDELTFESEAPVQLASDGRYPAPDPGRWAEV